MDHESLIRLLKAGAENWNRWRESNGALDLDLAGADLSRLNLTAVDLHGVNLSGAKLQHATLREADLRCQI